MTVRAVAHLHYRKAGEEDLERTYEIFLEASQDLNRRHGRSADLTSSVPRVRALAFRSNVLGLDPERFWVAESGGDLVGFGAATQRDRVWYLAALHVIPRFQSQGAGGELLRRCLAASAKGSICTVVTDSINPVSNALYGKYGMFPQTALVTLEGPTSGPAGSSDLSLEKLKTGAGGPDTFEAADVAVLGYRPVQRIMPSGAECPTFTVSLSGGAGRPDTFTCRSRASSDPWQFSARRISRPPWIWVSQSPGNWALPKRGCRYREFTGLLSRAC